MRKIFVLSSLLFLLSITLFAKPVDEATAKKVGLSFLQLKTQLPLENLSINTLHLAYAERSKTVFGEIENTTTYFYIFNVDNDKGFIIVSADDIALPVLGYSTEHAFDASNIPINTAKWFEGYKNEIRFAIENNIEQDAETKTKWNTLIEAATTNIVVGKRGTPIVNPLVQTHWDQSQYYSDLCPYDNTFSDRTVTGCVATAMAQVIKYWNYPATGTGFYSYIHSKYGILSANFGATTYQWGAMPNSVISTNNAVATLMYHCGVSVNMDYGVSATGGSSTSSLSPVKDALKTYFGYDNSVQFVSRSNYTFTSWVLILKNELNLNRPIEYAGVGTSTSEGKAGGHAFVCDGYDDNNYFHFNWGWSGNSDGFFSLNSLDPSNTGIGAGPGVYNNLQQAVIGIKPLPPPIYTLKLYNTVVPSSSSIIFNQPFSVSTNIANLGTASFNGDYCAAIFDNTNTFVDYVEIKSAQTLQNGYAYTNNLVFSNTGMLAMMPGTYKVGIYHRPTGGQWSLVADNGTYTNFPTITVTYTNSIAIYSTITPNPTTLVKGQPASFNVNIANVGSSTFYGTYYLALYNLDGSLEELIDSMIENTGLPTGSAYALPYLTFSKQVINANPGTYLMGVLHRSNTSSSGQLTGANFYQNPTKVVVKAADLLPDAYEVNDTITQAYTLPITFVGKTANPKTTGSNCHKGNDYDFYKIVLPAGYNYSIIPRLHDAYNSGNGNAYTLDGLFSYSLNGTTWSEAYDDTITSKILQTNGGTIYFAVAPYFAGGIGTYLLDIKVDKIASYVNGNLITPLKKSIKNINLKISKDSIGTSIVDNKYESVLNYNGNYTIRPTKNNDINKSNGVSTADVVLVQRHILNLAKLNSAYKLIAADVTNDKIINSTDIIRMKRLILGLDTTFAGSRLWAFVDSAYQFADTTNPFPYKDSISFTNLTSNKTNQTFIGLKLGDVNYDWNATVAKQSTANSQQSTALKLIAELPNSIPNSQFLLEQTILNS